MPPERHARGYSRKAPPDGFDDIEKTLLEFANRMKDAETAPHEGKKKNEATWDIFRISHQRRFFFFGDWWMEVGDGGGEYVEYG